MENMNLIFKRRLQLGRMNAISISRTAPVCEKKRRYCRCCVHTSTNLTRIVLRLCRGSTQTSPNIHTFKYTYFTTGRRLSTHTLHHVAAPCSLATTTGRAGDVFSLVGSLAASAAWPPPSDARVALPMARQPREYCILCRRMQERDRAGPARAFRRRRRPGVGASGPRSPRLLYSDRGSVAVRGL